MRTESKENVIELYKQSHAQKLDGKLINEVVEAIYVSIGLHRLNVAELIFVCSLYYVLFLS